MTERAKLLAAQAAQRRDHGVTVSQIARDLGVSRTRVYQLLKAAGRGPAPPPARETFHNVPVREGRDVLSEIMADPAQPASARVQAVLAHRTTASDDRSYLPDPLDEEELVARTATLLRALHPKVRDRVLASLAGE